MENIDEKSMYNGLISCAMIDLKMFSEAVDTVEELLKEPKEIITLVLSKKKIEEVHVKVMEKMNNDLSKIHIRLQILKNKINKDDKRIKPYFKKFNDFKDKYEQDKNELMKKIKKHIKTINALMLKAGIYVEENDQVYRFKNNTI